MAALSPFGLIKLFTTKSRFEALHPREPHYYVFAIATDKARRGVANQMAARLFAISDPEDMPVYAETQEQQTLEWSYRIGFRVLRRKS